MTGFSPVVELAAFSGSDAELKAGSLGYVDGAASLVPHGEEQPKLRAHPIYRVKTTSQLVAIPTTSLQVKVGGPSISPFPPVFPIGGHWCRESSHDYQ